MTSLDHLSRETCHCSNGPQVSCPERTRHLSHAMSDLPRASAASIVATALALQRSHPQAPAADVLTLAVDGHAGRSLDFGAAALLPHPFAVLVSGVFDRVMLPSEWIGLLASAPGQPERQALLGVWRHEVWARFVAHHRL